MGETPAASSSSSSGSSSAASDATSCAPSTLKASRKVVKPSSVAPGYGFSVPPPNQRGADRTRVQLLQTLTKGSLKGFLASPPPPIEELAGAIMQDSAAASFVAGTAFRTVFCLPALDVSSLSLLTSNTEQDCALLHKTAQRALHVMCGSPCIKGATESEDEFEARKEVLYADLDETDRALKDAGAELFSRMKPAWLSLYVTMGKNSTGAVKYEMAKAPNKSNVKELHKSINE